VSVFSLGRVGAMMLRYTYTLRSSWLRALETVYWPTIQLLTWGFLQSYFASAGAAQSGPARLAGTLIGAVLLWDVLLRTQQGFSFSFLEEIWSRNLANLMMSPLRMSEFIVALMAMSVIRLSIGVVPVIFLAIALFGFNLWSLGAAVGVFFVALAFFAWSIGLVVSGMLMRYGLGAESLAWSLMFLVQPFGCVYFPVSALPSWLQPLALALPPTYVFEGLRGLLLDHVFHSELMVRALALDAFYFVLASLAFSHLLAKAREVGSLLQTGE
jgi:ABC-2 type transport system permease protein